MYKSKIEKIDELLENEKSFSKYIDALNKDNNIEIPHNLNEKILKSIKIIDEKDETTKLNNIDNGKKNKNINNEKVIKLRKIDILKVASFTLFTVIMWNLLFSSTTLDSLDEKKFDDKMEEEIKIQEKLQVIQENKNNITNKITTFFITPNLDDEGGLKL